MCTYFLYPVTQALHSSLSMMDMEVDTERGIDLLNNSISKFSSNCIYLVYIFVFTQDNQMDIRNI